MKKIIYLLFLTIVTSEASYGDISMCYKNGFDSRCAADKLVSSLVNAYENYSRIRFSDLVSDDFAPDKLSLLDAAEQGFYSRENVNISFFLGSVNAKGDTLSASVSWEMSFVSRNSGGNPEKATGRAIFTFVRTGTGWMLKNLKGDNPFKK